MQSFGIATRVIAASMALSAFAVAIVSGLAVGNPPRAILVSAVICMIACQILGLFVGMFAERAVTEHLSEYRAARPIPSAGGATSAPAGIAKEEKISAAPPAPLART